MRIDAIYARQSIEKRDSISIESQIEMCKRAADPDAAIYRDSGYSGKNTQRPAFTQLMADVRAGKIKRVFCYRLDRISRSVLDFSLLWQTFDANHIDFVSVTESFDTNSPMGRAMIMIIITFAQLERETIVSRYTTNRYARSNAGIWAGGRAPYGFEIQKVDWNGKRQSVLKPIPEKLQIVQDLFTKYTSGTASLYSLSKELNLNSTERWDAITVRRILKNPVYACADVDVYSFYYGNAEIINDVHEFDGSHAAYLVVKGGKSSAGHRTLSLAYHQGVVPSSVFIAAQNMLSQNKQLKNGHRSSFTWLSGLLKCHKCGGRINVFQNKGLTYFQCYKRFHQAGSCDAKIHGNSLRYESYVEDAIQNRIDTIVKNNSTEDVPNQQLNDMKIQLLENERQINNLVEALKIGGAVAMRSIQNELQALEAEHERITNEITAMQPVHQVPNGLAVIDFAKLDYDSKRDVARMMIDKILVGDDSPIQIIWK